MNRHAHNLSKHLWGVVLLLFTLLPQALHSQEAKITTSIAPDEIQIGEVAIIDIVIRTSDLDHRHHRRRQYHKGAPCSYGRYFV